MRVSLYLKVKKGRKKGRKEVWEKGESSMDERKENGDEERRRMKGRRRKGTKEG